MKFGVMFPHFEMEVDAGAVKAFAQGVEALGYDYIAMGDHVLGPDMSSRPYWTGPADNVLHREPFVISTFMAAVTTKVGFSTSIMITPQRQTVLVAKQAADLDVLSGGRFRLGIGTGWNEVEYEALGVNFADRAKIFEDQIGVMRALWANDKVTISTPWHKITNAGLNPRPAKPIPIWLGSAAGRTATSEKVLRRIARLADGWMPMGEPDDERKGLLEQLHGYCREYGRDPAAMGLEGFAFLSGKARGDWADRINAWAGLGATHLTVTTILDGLQGVEQHLRRFEEVRQAIPTALR